MPLGPPSSGATVATQTALLGPPASGAIAAIPGETLGPPLSSALEGTPGLSFGPPFSSELESAAGDGFVRGKQIASLTITSDNLAPDAIAATAAGRDKMANGYFDGATAGSKLVDGAISAAELVETYVLRTGANAYTGDQDGGGQRLSNLGTPTAASDAARLEDAPVLRCEEQNPMGATSGNDQATGVTLSFTPVFDSYLAVRVNGVLVVIGDAVKTEDCYFSGDSGATARAINDLTVGDELYWNGIIAGYDLAASDRIDLDYLA